MKQISKNSPPRALVEYSNTPFAIYDGSDFPKEDLRKSILAEQGHICCYCLKRIPEKVTKNGGVSYEMKIEHLQCQDDFPLLQLTYNNLFGACTGNEGKPRKLQTCDTRKGNKPVTINLLTDTPNCESLFKYNAEGEISSVADNETINNQLTYTLNLNMQTLKDGRRQVYLEVQKKVETESRQLGTGQLKLKYFETERLKWMNRADNKYKPFCMVAIYYLTKKIRQYQN